VFEEWRTGPTPGVSVPPDVIAALRDGKLLPVSDLDAGFIRPTYPNQVQVSYMQAGLVCLFIEQHWGFERLVALLKQFTRETTSAAAIEATFKIAPTEFDKQFDAFARQRYQGILAGMEEWEKLYQSARAAIEAEKWQEALEPARQAAELYPEHVGPGSPRLLLAKALLKLDRRDEAIVEIDRYRRAGGWDPAVLRELAALLDKTGRDAEAIEVLNALNLADPLNPEQHITLGDHLLAANAPDAALREFKVLLALNPHDMAGANFGAARALRALGDKPASRRYLLDALATAPHYKPAQELLLTIVEERSRNE
jgi:predicted Zn-dependent protease